jgi:TetR/AcrR family transcriptional regulator
MAEAARPRVPSKAQRTRAAILAAAEHVFAERGFAASRLEDVAARVGIRRASIVYHFRDKRELYDAVLEEALGALLAALAPVLLGPGPLAARIEGAVGAFLDALAARPALARLLLREAADAGAGPAALAAHLAPFHALARAAIARERSERRPARLAVDPLPLATTIAGATLFFVAGMPALMPGRAGDPREPRRLAAQRRELIAITQRLLEPPRAPRRLPRAPRQPPHRRRRP